MSDSLILITISGKDAPGITASMMSCIKESKASIKDMAQSITHGLLSLSILLDIKDEPNKVDSDLMKNLLFNSKKLDLDFDFQRLDSFSKVQLVGEKYILSCVSSNRISADFIFDITNTLAKYEINILRIDNLSDDNFNTLDISAIAKESNLNWQQVKEELISISNIYSIDLALIKDNVWRRNKRLIVLDMDSTLIQSEVIVEMAKVHGAYDEVHKITEMAMNGDFDFNESLVKRVSLLKGLKEDKLEEILSTIKLTDGVSDFIKTVKKLGYKVAIISGGFSYFANHFKEKLKLDYAFANDLEIQNGELTGKIKGSIVNAEKKAMLLEMLAQQDSISLEQVVAIGDGANDLPMLSKAGLGVAFHAKDIVKKNANQHMSHGKMDSILYFLGIPGVSEY